VGGGVACVVMNTVPGQPPMRLQAAPDQAASVTGPVVVMVDDDARAAILAYARGGHSMLAAILRTHNNATSS
jgi:hypothetical protein